jgi:hypothetical protein
MNMKHTTTLLAAAATLAMLAFAGAPAYATDDTAAQVNQSITQNQSQTGDILWVNLQFDQDQNAATIQDNACTNATGNVGANVTAGNGNQQANVALIDAHSPTYNFSGNYTQATSGEGLVLSGVDNASIGAKAFEFASGDVNANVAAGVWNQQGNAMFVAADDTLGTQTIYAKQDDDVTGCAVCGLNNAHFTGNAFNHSSGSINANVASGDLNKQLNMMTIAANGGNSNVSMTQSSFAHLYLVAGLNTALIDSNAFDHATGNVNANLASGTGNEQMNRSNIDNSNTGDTTTIDQDLGFTFDCISGGNVANIAQNAFANAAGQIGVNTTAGYENQQANALSVSH